MFGDGKEQKRDKEVKATSKAAAPKVADSADADNDDL